MSGLDYGKVLSGKLTADQKRRVWPACSDGLHMPCGRIHDFGRMEYTYRKPGEREWAPDVCCWMNHEKGCPSPLPERVDWPVWNGGPIKVAESVS